MGTIKIREATTEDFEAIWPIFDAVVSVGETYAYATDTTQEQAYHIWMELPRKTYVVEQNGEILATYYLKSNQAGPGDHVCNCGHMVSSDARRQGLATTMCEHSMTIAKSLGYKAMQYNFVASTNDGAVRLWEKLGFEIVGCVPKAFKHPQEGYVDAYVMYQWL